MIILTFTPNHIAFSRKNLSKAKRLWRWVNFQRERWVSFQRELILVILAFLAQLSLAFSQTKIIDMHIHSYSEADFGEREPTSDHYGNKGASNAEVHRIETFAAFKKWNIVKAMVSGNPQSVDEWAAKDSNNLIIRGILIF